MFTGKISNEFETVYYTIISGQCVEFHVCDEGEGLEVDFTVNGWNDHLELDSQTKFLILRWVAKVFKQNLVKDFKGQTLECFPFDDHHRSTRLRWLNALEFKKNKDRNTFVLNM